MVDKWLRKFVNKTCLLIIYLLDYRYVDSNQIRFNILI